MNNFKCAPVTSPLTPPHRTTLPHQVATLYNIDVDPMYVPQRRAQEASRPRTQLNPADASYVVTVDVDELLCYGSLCSERDVLKNLGNLRHCDKCKEPLGGVSRQCDGCYPVCTGLSYPQGGLGRQHGCYRGTLCHRPRCNEDVGEYWYCQACDPKMVLRIGAKTLRNI